MLVLMPAVLLPRCLRLLLSGCRAYFETCSLYVAKPYIVCLSVAFESGRHLRYRVQLIRTASVRLTFCSAILLPIASITFPTLRA